jgi:hypothetical protein
MDNIWRYSIEESYGGIVIANSEVAARKKIKEAYKKHRDPIENDNDLVVWEATKDDDGYFEDAPDVLECY